MCEPPVLALGQPWDSRGFNPNTRAEAVPCGLSPFCPGFIMKLNRCPRASGLIQDKVKLVIFL